MFPLDIQYYMSMKQTHSIKNPIILYVTNESLQAWFSVKIQLALLLLDFTHDYFHTIQIDRTHFYPSNALSGFSLVCRCLYSNSVARYHPRVLVSASFLP